MNLLVINLTNSIITTKCINVFEEFTGTNYLEKINGNFINKYQKKINYTDKDSDKLNNKCLVYEKI